MNLPSRIESAEHKYRQILEEFFISIFDTKVLISHGIDHHRRVWAYAKELITHMDAGHSSLQIPDPEKLIIACYLHDIGMAINPGLKHGRLSMQFCTQFLKSNGLNTVDFEDVLYSIENHDSKDYNLAGGRNDLLTILSASDDLDAFGFTGIYRYSEIYLTRGINPEKIGYLIVENALKRFDHFVKRFGYLDPLLKKHKEKYNILINFFNQYNKEIQSYHFGGQNPTGNCGIVELLISILNNKRGLKEFFIEGENHGYDPVIRQFFDGLKSELS